MVIEAAASGLGFALLPLYLIENELSDGRLQIATDKPMTTENSYCVVLPEGKQERAQPNFPSLAPGTVGTKLP
jgi:LysR family glycine cleavage system transcriptional activator